MGLFLLPKESHHVEILEGILYIISDTVTEMRSRSSTIITHSDGQASKHSGMGKSSSVTDLLEQQVSVRLQSLTTRTNLRYMPCKYSKCLSVFLNPYFLI